MKPSRKFLSLPIISLQEGQQIGHVKSLILDAAAKALAAIVVDTKGFFSDQRIIPYAKVVSVGDDAITINKESHVAKASGLPELFDLAKEKLTIIGTKMVTETGKTLGIADEYYVDPQTGKITQIEISGGKIEGLLNGKALLSAEYIMTIGHDVIIAKKDSENTLNVKDKGLSDSLKNLFHSTSHFASESTQTVSNFFKKGKLKPAVAPPAQDKEPIILPDAENTPLEENQTVSETPVNKEPLG